MDQLIGSIAAATRRGRLPDVIERIRRSWYVFVLCTPGGPTLIWRGVMGGGRWRTWLRYVERVPGDVDYPRRSISADGLHGSNLYRRNIVGRVLRPRHAASARVPVQLIVPKLAALDTLPN